MSVDTFILEDSGAIVPADQPRLLHNAGPAELAYGNKGKLEGKVRVGETVELTERNRVFAIGKAYVFVSDTPGYLEQPQGFKVNEDHPNTQEPS